MSEDQQNSEVESGTESPEEFKGTISRPHIGLIRDLAEETDLSEKELLDKALDEFLLDIGYIDERKLPKFNLEEHFSDRAKVEN